MTAQEKRYQLDQASTDSKRQAHNDVLQASLIVCAVSMSLLSQSTHEDLILYFIHLDSHHKL